MLLRICMNISEPCIRRLGCFVPFWYHILSLKLYIQNNWCIYRSLKLTLKSLKQTIGDLILRRKIWLSSTASTREIWTGNNSIMFHLFPIWISYLVLTVSSVADSSVQCFVQIRSLIHTASWTFLMRQLLQVRISFSFCFDWNA